MRKLQRGLSFVVLCCGIAQAQDAKPLPRHPGDIIKFEIKFDGPNSDKIKSIDVGLGIRGSVPKDQLALAGSFGTPQPVSPISRDTFRVELTVPNNAATGDYFLNIGAHADEGFANYSEGQEFNIPPIHIENPKSFVPPSITVKQLP